MILDLTQHLAGPFCKMLLADMGAEVIKVELPWGDESRKSTGYAKLEGQSSYFMFRARLVSPLAGWVYLPDSPTLTDTL